MHTTCQVQGESVNECERVRSKRSAALEQQHRRGRVKTKHSTAQTCREFVANVVASTAGRVHHCADGFVLRRGDSSSVLSMKSDLRATSGKTTLLPSHRRSILTSRPAAHQMRSILPGGTVSALLLAGMPSMLLPPSAGPFEINGIVRQAIIRNRNGRHTYASHLAQAGVACSRSRNC
jgi:hypothetical protein